MNHPIHILSALPGLIMMLLVGTNVSAQENIGIGTTNPDDEAILELFSTDQGFLPPRMDSAQRVSIPVASDDAGLLVYDRTDSAYYYWDGLQWNNYPVQKANDGDWTRNNNDIYTANPSDSVGIGTTNPTTQLDIKGADVTPNSGAIKVRDDDNDILYMDGDEIQAGIGGSSADDALYLQDDITNDVVMVRGGGNVGIGTSPAAKLHVDGSVRFQNLSSGTQNQVLVVDGNGNVNTRSLGSDIWDGDDVADNDADPQNELQSLNASQSGNQVDISITNGSTVNFNVADDDNDPNNEYQTLSISKSGSTVNWSLSNDGSGSFSVSGSDNDWTVSGDVYNTSDNIGIGTSSPSHLLHVKGSNDDPIGSFENDDTGLNTIGVEGVSDNDGSGASYYEAIGVYGRATGNLNTGINAGVKGWASNTDDRNYGVYAYAPGDPTGTDYGIYAETKSDGEDAGYFNGDITVTGTFNNPSDKKLKKNVEVYTSALAKLDQVKTYAYNFKQKGSLNLPEGQHYGFVAQEVEQIMPELVEEKVHAPATSKNGDKQVTKKRYKSVNYLEFIPLLTQALNEQQKLIKQQKKQIQQLIEQNKKQQKQIEQLMENK